MQQMVNTASDQPMTKADGSSYKIGILLCGLSHPNVGNKHGYYDVQFRELLEPFGFVCQTYAVVANQFPTEDDDCDGYLISGSAHNLDDPLKLPWTQPLLDWTRNMYGKKPMVGICFGHQVIAAALGGKVADADVVYQTGVIPYTKLDGSVISVAAWHGQQVLELPPVDLDITLTGEHCPYAGIVYKDKAISYQPHPEFSDTYISDLYSQHEESMQESGRKWYQERLGRHQVDHPIGREIAEFYWANA
jgi:GMP synthase (glutamine-hydrolysing)